MNNQKMSRYVAFLRGINVGAHNRMKMAALRQMCAGLGFENVQTYIQSGNVLFESTEADIDVLQEKIETEIEKTFGYDVTAIVCPGDDLQALASNNPFAPEDGDETVKLYVTFLRDTPDEEQIQTLISAQTDAETFAVEGSIVYTRVQTDKHTPGRYIDVEKQLGMPATRRTWRVVKKVLDML